ncbi:hypothetical protein HRG_007498 [Hirsutella rhossiliensis]|uniref:Uncharacterized protein n=1 Tax=Hirsutella rhossiliensis TaxID=111463 RepID=A0A9P8MUD6_9HYPO|nr:uncharacterized protein HRG_07498 [Hirsutella rhossiliensis]KAH0961420.1 hypothetical protein HRG_07498 [Hirsutella rhossiliensis]
MALEVQASRQHPQDFSCKWRLRTLLGPAPRPDVLQTGPTMAKAQGPLLASSKQLLGNDTHHSHSWDTRGWEPKAATRRSCSPRPPTAPVSSPRRAKPSQFLPIASLLNPHTGLKRRRHDLDVDGPNTAALSSKKRRLRLHLVTSPLSRPYAQPASHIHVRTDTKATASRSAKEATVSAQPRLPHLPATSFLRLSVVNRMRERMELRGPPILRPGRPDASLDTLDPTPRASWFQSRSRYEPGGRMLGPGPSDAGAGRRLIAKRPDRLCPSRERPLPPPEKTLPELQSQPTPLPTGLRLAAIDTITSLLSDAPPLASEDRLFTSVHDDFGQDGFSFSNHSDQGFHDASEEPRDLYCNFGVLLGKVRPRCAGGPDQRGGDAEGLKEVPWVAR